MGFRPFIFNLAEKISDQKATFLNDELGVIIVCQGENSEQFLMKFINRKPKSSEIIFLKSKKLKQQMKILIISISNLPKKNIVVDIPVNSRFATCNLVKPTFDERNPRYFILLPLGNAVRTEIFRD